MPAEPWQDEARSRSARLRAELAGLRQRLEELERRLGLNSGHSGKPPAGRRTRNQRGPAGAPAGV